MLGKTRKNRVLPSMEVWLGEVLTTRTQGKLALKRCLDRCRQVGDPVDIIIVPGLKTPGGG